MGKCIGAAITALLIAASTPAFAFYQEMKCERNTATGALEPEPNVSAYAVKQWDSYRIIAERDYGLANEPVAVPGRPGWVFGTCLFEGHWSRIPEDAPVRFPRQ